MTEDTTSGWRTDTKDESGGESGDSGSSCSTRNKQPPQRRLFQLSSSSSSAAAAVVLVLLASTALSASCLLMVDRLLARTDDDGGRTATTTSTFIRSSTQNSHGVSRSIRSVRKLLWGGSATYGRSSGRPVRGKTVTVVHSGSGSGPSAAASPSNVARARPAIPDYGGSSWCPDAACFNAENLCYPCKRRWLIILATGRSASTTLTYMLDSLPGVRMAGENNDEVRAVERAVGNIRDNSNFRQSTGQKGPWGHNPVPKGAYGCVAQQMLETINPPLFDKSGRYLRNQQGIDDEDDLDTIIGFKTIRLLEGGASGSGDGDDDRRVEEAAKLLRETFPCAKFVVNVRSAVQHQAESRTKSFGPSRGGEGAVMEELAETNRQMRLLAKLLGDGGEGGGSGNGSGAMFMDSSSWLWDVDEINYLVEWLGFDAEKCRFAEILEFNTKGGGYGNGNTVAHLDPECRYVG